jgi:hypothetical protein
MFSLWIQDQLIEYLDDMLQLCIPASKVTKVPRYISWYIPYDNCEE